MWVETGVGVGRQVHRLSAKQVEKENHPGYSCDGSGLYLQVSPTLSKSWIFRFSRHGKSREMGLGSQREVTLAEARVKAANARRQLVDGIDPIANRDGRRAEERLQKAGTIAFGECAKNTSLLTVRAGAIRNTQRNGKAPSTPMPGQ